MAQSKRQEGRKERMYGHQGDNKVARLINEAANTFRSVSFVGTSEYIYFVERKKGWIYWNQSGVGV